MINFAILSFTLAGKLNTITDLQGKTLKLKLLAVRASSLRLGKNNYIGADKTSQSVIDFDWYNPHPYHRTTRTPKKIQLTRYFAPHKSRSWTKHTCMKACKINSTLT